MEVIHADLEVCVQGRSWLDPPNSEGAVRQGKIFYQEFFWDHAQALESLGLSEHDAHADSS